ncbi:NUDIX hydrolase [soil metagenome]
MSAEELIDELDASGNVIGVTTRADMRARRLPHRCTYILVFNRRGELFIHQRTPTKDVFPSFWDVTVGGVVSAGETFDLGAVREGAEELGVAIEPEFLFPFHFSDQRTTCFGQVYRAVHDGPFQLQVEEIVQGEFVAPDEVLERAEHAHFCPDGIKVWKQYLRRELNA